MAHRDLGAPGTRAVEAEHHDFQPMAAVGALKEAGLDEVIGVAGREVDPPVGQAVAVRGGRRSKGSAWLHRHLPWLSRLNRLPQTLGTALPHPCASSGPRRASP